jgi:hypothetical protein
VISRVLGGASPTMGPLRVPTVRLPCSIHAHDRADLPSRTALAPYGMPSGQLRDNNI